MALDPRISLAIRPFELRNPIDDAAKVASIRGSEQQQAMNQLQMQRFQREQETSNALNRAYAEAYDPQTGEIDVNRLRQSMVTGGVGSSLPNVEKHLGEIKTQQLAQQKTRGDVLDAELKRSRAFLEGINPNDPDAAEAYMLWHEANHKNPVIGPALAAWGMTPERARKRITQLINTPGGLTQLISESKLGTEKFMEMNKPQLSTKDTGSELIDRTFQPLTSQLTTIGVQQKAMGPGEAERIKNETTRIKQEGQRIGLEGRRVAVLEENNRRDADPEFQQRMEVARATGKTIAKNDVAAAQVLPKVISRAEESMRLIDELIGKRDPKTGQLLIEDPVTGESLKNNKPHPGFQNAVGATWLPGSRFIPGTDAAGFMSRLDQIKGVSFLEAFESLKGGGAITEKEGQKGTDAINRMSVSTDEQEFIRAALDLRSVVRKGIENAQGRAAKLGGAGPIAPVAPAAGGVKFLGFE